MKILIINVVCGVGSTGKICAEYAEKLFQNGDEVYIAYGRGKVPERYKKYAKKITNQAEVLWHVLQTRIFDNAGHPSKRATIHFVKWVKEFDPDIVYLHNLHGYYLNLEILFKYLKESKKKIVWTLHDCWAFTGHCSHFSYAKCDRWKTGCYDCIQKKVYPASFLFDRSKKNWEEKKEMFSGIDNLSIVTPSDWLASLVKQSYLGEYPVEVKRNQIDTNIFKPVSSDFRSRFDIEKKIIVLGVSSVWNETKGLGDFLKLSDLLDNKYVVILIGLTRAQINKINRFNKKILCIERTNNAMELAGVYSTADVFVNLTYEDTYPTVNLEAQACGTPCITYATGGSVESVPTENVVAQGDLEGVVKAIERLTLR